MSVVREDDSFDLPLSGDDETFGFIYKPAETIMCAVDSRCRHWWCNNSAGARIWRHGAGV